MMKLPTRPKTRIKENEDGHYEVTILFPMDNKTEFDELISAALKEGDRLIGSDWEAKTVTLSTNDIRAFEKRLNLFRIMGIPKNS